MKPKIISVSRRAFLRRAGLLLGASYAACRPETPASALESPGLNFQHPVGVQLYTLRNQITADPEAALRGISEIGFTQVEILSQTLPRLAPLLKQYGLDPVSGHFPLPLVTGNFDAWTPGVAAGLENWTQAVELAASHGLRHMVIAYIQQTERTSADFYRRFADQMNQAGQQSRDAGIQLAYHHHAFEFEPLQGEVPFEILAERFDPQLVQWQLDMFWLKMAGKDPAASLEKYTGRVVSVHLKDVAPGVESHFQESQVGPGSFAEVGSGSLDFRAILQAAESAGVQYYFVEQDHTAGDPIESLRTSYQFLKGQKA